MAFERYRKRIGEEEAKQQAESMEDLCDNFNKSDVNEHVAVNKITSLVEPRYFYVYQSLNDITTKYL